MALTAPETTFITTHQTPVVVGMKPYLRQDQYLATGKPLNTVMPVITGTPAVGQVLSCSTGTWLNSPTFTYQWRRSGVPIAGATAATYTVVTADAGMRVSCVVTGTAGGSSISVAAHGLTIAVPFAGPSVVSFNPVDNLIGEPMMADLIATFGVPVTLGNGLVYLKKTTDGSVVASWNAAYAGSGPGRMEVVGGNAMTMHMLTPLLSGVEYYVTWDRGIVVDASANPALALTDPTAWSFVAAIPVASPEVYLDFAANTSLVNGTPGTAAALLTTTRAGTAYVDNLAGVWASVAANTARRSDKGLLVEEARTNSIRNNSGTGVVPGTPGTLPTNWSISSSSGLSSQVVGTGVENGIDYLDFRMFGTATGGSFNLLIDINLTIAAVNAQIWALSSFISVQAGSYTNVGNKLLIIWMMDGAGALVGNVNALSGMAPVSGALGVQRFSGTATLNQATTAYIRPLISLNMIAGPVDLTLRIGWPQLELGAFATSPIRTTAAAVTRAQDGIVLTTPPAFGSAYSAYVAGVPNAPVAFANAQYPFAISDGTNNNRMVVARNATTGTTAFLTISGGASQFSQPVSIATNPGVPSKYAIAATAGDQGGAANGTLTLPGTALLPVGVNAVRFGARNDGALPWDGYITQAAIWANARLSNAQLQQITMVGVTP